MEIKEFQQLKQIYDSSNSIVYRGLWRAKSVIIKILKSEYPTIQQINRYQQEYYLTHDLNIEGVIKAYNLLAYQRSFAIIFEDLGAISLKQLYAEKIIDLSEFLPLAIQICNSLHNIHRAKIIHKDINPSNIVYSPQTQQLKIIDLGIATQLQQEYLNPNGLEGTLPYISPEQSGRMNRSLDYRSDFYSLGVTFYELLTGQLPFITNDALEMIHCHLARQPIAPQDINPKIPEVLSAIILKLMAKNAEERYQSCQGIKADLEICWQQLRETNKIIEFTIGEWDIQTHFQIPQKLYGRELEIRQLLETFTQVSQGARALMLVSGYSGIGKTSLIQEIYKPVTYQKGYFISGKFDQIQRNIPYAGFIDALRELVKQILTEREDKIQSWREQIVNKLDTHLTVILENIPEIKLILGSAVTGEDNHFSDYQSCFDTGLLLFIDIFAQASHPLVIFLDDLQWADLASLKFLQTLITQSASQHLFIIGTYRDNEVEGIHPLLLTLEEIRKTGFQPQHIQLLPLQLNQVNQLLSDTLKSNLETISPLGQLIFEKTQGNPFFINEFLKCLDKEQLVRYEVTQKKWQWNLEAIQGIASTENVIDLMMFQLTKLQDNVQKIIQLAACLGNQFEIKTLAIVCQKSESQILDEMWPLITAGFIIPCDHNYQLYRHNNSLDKPPALFKFIHDRIQQASYLLIPKSSRPIIHQRIGNLLLNNLSRVEQEKEIFNIVNHLNIAHNLLDKEAEKEQLSRLNLMAGQKAKATAAYKTAYDYFQTGLELLPPNCWQNNYTFTLGLYIETAEASYLCGEFEQMEKLTQVVIEKAYNLLDKVRVYEVKIAAYMAQYDLKRVVDTGLKVLHLLGVDFPGNPNLLQVGLSWLKSYLIRLGKPIVSLANLPTMTDPFQLAVIRIINTVVSAVYMVNPWLFLMFISKGVCLSIRYGNALFSPGFYAAYGLLLCGVMGDISQGYRFGNLALDVLERNPIKPNKNTARVAVVVNYFIRVWCEPFRKLLSPLINGYLAGLQTGELEYAFYSLLGHSWLSYFAGLELSLVASEAEQYKEILSKYKKGRSFYLIELNRQNVLNLQGKTDNYCQFDIDIFDEYTGEFINFETTDRSFSLHYYVYKMVLCYLFGDSQTASNFSRLAQKYLDSAVGMPTYGIFYFFDSLIKTSLYPQASPIQKTKIYLQLHLNLRKLKKWAKYAPSNYLHKYHLVAAEINRIMHKNSQARDNYERAIKLANQNQFLQEEALAYELAAQFYLFQNQPLIAKTYLQEAHYCYARWGAFAKVKQLENIYPDLIPSSSPNSSVTFYTSVTDTDTTQILDIATIMKASQAITEELVLDKLLINLIKIMITNAGAQKGYLLLENHGQLYIEAQGNTDNNSFQVLQSLSVANHLPISVINYVANSRNSLILTDACHAETFSNDPYIQTGKIKSLLCAPLINQGQLKGLVYLENNLTTGAFTEERLELIQLLSGQASIAIENAQLYNNLEQKVKERTEKLSQTLDTLKIAQEELIQSEKLAALGQLIAGIAHEINNPLGVINSGANNINYFLTENFQTFLEFWSSLTSFEQSLVTKLFENLANFPPLLSTREERHLKKSLLQQLSSHGINLEDNSAKILIKLGIANNLEACLNLLQQPQAEKILIMLSELADAKTSIKNILIATERASKVVFALKTYSHQEQDGTAVETDVIETIETVLTLYQNLFKQGVEIKRNYGINLPKVFTYTDQINQVWTNLIYNALQAMNFRGTLNITVQQQADYLEIKITDSGIGIPSEIMPRIFEPFFTTKPAGEGSGLGLHIVRQIIDKHRGKIEATSQVGETTFTVYLPL